MAGLSLAAKGLWLEGLLYACQHDNGGFVPTEEFAQYELEASELVDAKLWRYAVRGWEIHDFYEWNPEPNLRWQLGQAVRRGAGIDEYAWDHGYERQITESHLASGVTPDEVEAITRFIIQGWAVADKTIVGIPKFQTIIATKANWLLRQTGPQPAAGYFLRRIHDDSGNREDPGDSLFLVEEQRISG